MIKLIVTDDHQLFREGIISLLAKDEQISILAEASSGEELLTLLNEHQPHVVLIDISMSGMNGLDVIKTAGKKHPAVKFIVITMHAEGQYVVKAVRNGAAGYMLKNSDESELIEAIKTVANGKKYFNQQISELMIGNMSIEGDTDGKLSEREIEVLNLVSEGKTTKEIADILFVSTRTVETHRMNMMKKLQVQNTAELIKKSVRLKII
ncbi:MAG: response regulator transcription factor [Cyclobacteriaceae bacterium]